MYASIRFQFIEESQPRHRPARNVRSPGKSLKIGEFEFFDHTGVRAWTGVLMPGLSKANLMDALRQRHVYSTTDRNCQLRFGLNGAMMGEVVQEPQDSVKISVQVEDPDAQDTIARVEILGDGEVIKTFQPSATKLDETFVPEPAPGKHYYYIRVVQTDGQKLWSAPIWIIKR